MDIGKNGMSMKIFFPTISGYWLLKMGLKSPKILKPTLPKWQLIASTEAALQVSSYKRVFWKHAGNLHENNHVKMWFQESCFATLLKSHFDMGLLLYRSRELGYHFFFWFYFLFIFFFSFFFYFLPFLFCLFCFCFHFVFILFIFST